MTVNDSDKVGVELTPAAPPSGGIDRTTAVLVAALAVAAFMAVLDGTAVSVSLENFQHTFDSPVSTIVWVTVGYLLAAALALPLVGWASDHYGGRRIFLIGLAVFVGGSLLSGIAWSAPSLIAFRVLQGFGGGLLEPSALALVAGVAPRHQIGRVMGVLSMIINIAPVIGPLFGGLMSATGLWRGIFLINIPLGLGVLLLALRLLPYSPPQAAGERTDLRGMLMLSPGFVAVLFAVNQWGAGARPWVPILSGVAGLLLLAGYVRHALTLPYPPVLNLRLLRERAFAGALAVMALVGLVMYGQLVSLPLYGESVHGLTGIRQGLLVTALGLGLLVSMSNSGRISDRVGPKPLVRGGSLVAAVGTGTFVAMNDQWPLPALFVLFLVVGLGFGFVANPAFSSVYRTLPPEAIAQGTTALFITVQLAASTAVTLIGFLLARGGPNPYTTLFVVLTGALLLISLLSSLLPGKPQ